MNAWVVTSPVQIRQAGTPPHGHCFASGLGPFGLLSELSEVGDHPRFNAYVRACLNESVGEVGCVSTGAAHLGGD